MGIFDFMRKPKRRGNAELLQRMGEARAKKAELALQEAKADAELREMQRKVEMEKLKLKYDEVRAEREDMLPDPEVIEPEIVEEQQPSLNDFLMPLMAGAMQSIQKRGVTNVRARTDNGSEGTAGQHREPAGDDRERLKDIVEADKSTP